METKKKGLEKLRDVLEAISIERIVKHVREDREPLRNKLYLTARRTTPSMNTYWKVDAILVRDRRIFYRYVNASPVF
ncbi:hypothetical protein [Thermofilum sp.]